MIFKSTEIYKIHQITILDQIVMVPLYLLYFTFGTQLHSHLIVLQLGTSFQHILFIVLTNDYKKVLHTHSVKNGYNMFSSSGTLP